jgi:hypothetical protein
LNWEYLILINSSFFAILLGIIDYRTKLLPNKIVFSFLITNICIILISPSFYLSNLIYSATSSLLVFLVYLGIYFLSKQSFGLGDVKYSFALSLAPTYLYGFSETINMHLVASPETDGPTGDELRALIDAALQRAMDQTMPQVLAAGGKSAALLQCLWAGWAEGLTNRPLAERCGTTPGTVSKKMRPTDHANTIATAAAVELKRHPAFASCGESVEAAERLVGALRNHLLEPEREGDVAPLRRWVQQYLSQS